MESKEKEMLERLKPEKHNQAKIILTTIKLLKEECKKKSVCTRCRYCKETELENWDEYGMTERICK